MPFSPGYSELVCKAAFIAAATLTQEALATEPVVVQRRIGKVASTGVGADQYGAACTCKGACTCQLLGVISLAKAFDAGSLPGMQHAVPQKIADRRHAHLTSKYETKAVALEHLAGLFSVQHSEATAWLNVMPTKDSWEMDDATAESALWLILGVSLGHPDEIYLKCECVYKGSDCHHAMTCDIMSGPPTCRHNHVCATMHVQALVRSGGTLAVVNTSWEPKEDQMKDKEYGDKGYRKRGGALISMLFYILMVHVSCLHPAGQMAGEKARKQEDAAAAGRSKRKMKDHEQDGTPGYTFVPFSIESYGRLEVEAENLLRDWATEAASTGAWEQDVFLQWTRKESSVSLIRGNATIFKRFVGCLIRGTGEHFQKEDDIPALDV